MNDNLGNRKYPRVKSDFPIVIDGRKGEVINIGLGGVLAIIKEDVPLMEEIAIDITLPNGLIKVSGACIRKEEYENNIHIAICFDESSFSRDAVEELRKYINRRLPKKKPKIKPYYGPEKIP